MTDVEWSRPRLENMEPRAFELTHVGTSLTILQLGRASDMGSNLSVHPDERVVEEAGLADRLSSDPLTGTRLLLLFL